MSGLVLGTGGEELAVLQLGTLEACDRGRCCGAAGRQCGGLGRGGLNG